MERVYEQIVSTTIGNVVQKLVSFSEDEIGRIWNIDADLENLKQSLLTIRSILEDAERKQVTNESVQIWLFKVEAVALDADYVIDQLNYYRLQSEIGEKVSLRSAQLSNFDSIGFPRQIAKEIMEIDKRIQSINEEARGFGLLKRKRKRKRIPACGDEIDTVVSLETDPFSVFIGREDDLGKVVRMVTRNPNEEEVLSVLPIVGIGGSGKTALIRKVYNDPNITSLFAKRIWVHVSQNSFDPVDVFKSIAASLARKRVDGSRQVVLQKLQRSLGNKKYLLVLDNVWDEDYNKWENFMRSLEGISSCRGNVILVSARNLNFANFVKTVDIHELVPLSEHDCWLIIKAKVFGGDDVPLMFETVGKNIAKRCRGLPLAAVVVGGMLRGKSQVDWVSIERNWGTKEDENVISKILKLSFDHLASPLLNKCLSLFSIFPRSWPMDKNVLINLWMAEGVLETDEEIDMELVGNEVSSILQQSSLLQVVKESNGEYYRMHDLVYDLASSILNSTFVDGARYNYRHITDELSEEEDESFSFFKNIANSSFVDGTRQSRYMWRPIRDEPSEEEAECLRSLYFGGELSPQICSSLTRLHILILVGHGIKELPNEIGKLISLKFLYILYTKVECLPDSIGELYLLQTLITPHCLKKLPDTLRFLISLRQLGIPNIKLPPEIGRVTSLQTLPYFQVGDEEGCGIRELGELKNLKGDIEINKLEKVCNKEDAKSADLFHKTNLLKLKLVWSESRADYEENDEDVLEGLQPHWNLESLKITGFKGSNFPSWTSRMAVREDVRDPWIGLDNLVDIELSDCVECEEIPTMGQLPRLKSLCFRHLSNLKSIRSSFYGIKENDVHNEMIVAFPALEKLELINMANLATWEDVELSRTQPDGVIVFPCLQYVNIENCEQLKKFPSKKAMQGLSRLQIVGCPILKQNLERGGSNESSEWSKVSHIPSIEMDGLPFSPHAQSQPQ